MLVSLPDEEFKVLSEDDLALLTKRFGCLHENRKNTRRVGSTCYICGKMGHFIAKCPEPAEPKNEHKHHTRDEQKNQSRKDYHGKHKSKDKPKKKHGGHKHKHKARVKIDGASDADTRSSNTSSSSSSEEEDQGRRRRLGYAR